MCFISFLFWKSVCVLGQNLLFNTPSFFDFLELKIQTIYQLWRSRLILLSVHQVWPLHFLFGNESVLLVVDLHNFHRSGRSFCAQVIFIRNSKIYIFFHQKVQRWLFTFILLRADSYPQQNKIYNTFLIFLYRTLTQLYTWVILVFGNRYWFWTIHKFLFLFVRSNIPPFLN